MLLVLADPLNASILRLLARGPLPVPELPNHLGPTSRTTRFSRLRELEGLGLIAREKEGGSPPITRCMLTRAGHALLPVARQLRRWLKEKPSGSQGTGELFGASETKALAVGWNSTAIRWLAERPCSLTELDAQSPPEVSYHEARKARAALAETGLIAPVPSGDRRQPYAPTEWARRMARALAAAIRWERDFLVEGVSTPTAVEAEALLLLLAPLIDPLSDRELDGECSLVLDDLGGVSVNVRGGRVASCAPGSNEDAESRISGSLTAWLEALAEGRTADLEMRGEIRLTTAIAERLHSVGRDLRSQASCHVHMDEFPKSTYII